MTTFLKLLTLTLSIQWRLDQYLHTQRYRRSLRSLMAKQSLLTLCSHGMPSIKSHPRPQPGELAMQTNRKVQKRATSNANRAKSSKKSFISYVPRALPSVTPSTKSALRSRHQSRAMHLSRLNSKRQLSNTKSTSKTTWSKSLKCKNWRQSFRKPKPKSRT